MERTIAYLNGKIWYRFIKVIYVLTICLTVVICVLLVVYDYAPEENIARSYVQCSNGYKLDSKRLKESGIDYFSSIEYSDKSKKIVKFICLINDPLHPSATELLKSDLTEFDDSKVYSIIHIYDERNWIKTIGYSLLITAISLLVFESFRRMFYYIVLGKIWPKK